MKKKIQLTLILLTVLLTSCNNESVENVKEEALKQFSIGLNLKTSYVFDKFTTIKDSISSYLEKESEKFVGIKTLLYDSTGKFIDSTSTYTKEIKDIELHFENMTEGDYVAVTIETIVDATDNYHSPNWSLQDISKLSTIKIVKKGETIPYHAIIGVSHASIHLERDLTISVSPHPIGSIVHTTWEGFGRSDFDCVGFYLKAAPTYYKLDPSLSEPERFGRLEKENWQYIGYTEFLNNKTDIWFVLGNGEIEYQWKYIQDEKIQDTSSTYPEGGEPKRANISSGNTYYAHSRYNVSTGGDTFFGTLDEKDKWKNTIEALPFYIKEPDVEIGSNISTVLDYMKKFEGQTTPINTENGYCYITYNNICSADRMEYLFITSQEELYLINVYIDKQSIQKKDLESFILNQGYFIWRNSPSGCYYLSDDERTRLFFTERGSEWLLQYY